MTDCIRPLARLAAVLLVSAVAFTTEANAVPIRYTLVVTPSQLPGNIVLAGTLGAVSFGGSNGPAILTFTFDGDTTNVVSYFVTAPPNWIPPNASGYENLVGTASVKITDAGTGAVLGQANILPAAGIFVSADTTNAGIGFGSFAVANQSDPGFPGEPLYPFAMEVPGGLLVRTICKATSVPAGWESPASDSLS